MPSADTEPGSPRAILRGALFYYGRLIVAANGHTAVRAVRTALQATPDESVLDLGCGSGGFCLAVPGDYVGIDLDPDYVAFARWRWRAPRRRFEVAALETLDGARRFDKAMMVSCLHHLSDADAAGVLGRLARMIRDRLVVVDLDPDSSNRLQAFLLARDRGRFVRPPAQQRALLERHFTVVADRRFRNASRTVVHTLFTCEPRR